MEIKQVTMVSKEDLKGLVNTLELNIQALTDGEVGSTIYSLARLKSNIEDHLREEI